MEKQKKNDRRKQLAEPYPKNLISAINEHGWRNTELPTENISTIMLEGLQYSISCLNEREQLVIRLRYQERRTLSAIGIELAVTGERVRSLDSKILRKLASPPLLGYIKYGKDAYEQLLAHAEEKLQQKYKNDKLQLPIEDIGLTVRSFNCLIKRGCRIVGDVVKLTEDEIVKTKNLGMRSAIEIADKLQEMGITGTEWDGFATKQKKEN